MAITHRIVDPSVAPGGDGSAANPWGSTQEALDSFPATGTHNQINVKSGTTDTFAAPLNLSTYKGNNALGVSTRLIMRGFSANIGDGGIGAQFSSSTWNTGSDNYISLIDLDIQATSGGNCITLSSFCQVQRCTLTNNNAGSGAVISGGNEFYFSRNKVTSPVGVRFNGGMIIFNTIIAEVEGVSTSSQQSPVINSNNITGALSLAGINAKNNYCYISNNNVYGGGSGGIGIYVNGSNLWTKTIDNNVIAEFTGGGGAGISLGTNPLGCLAGNTVYNCTTGYDVASADILYSESNETVYAPVFTDPANLDFSSTGVGRTSQGHIPQLHAVA